MKHKRKMRTAEEKAELVKGFLAAPNKLAYGESVGVRSSTINKWVKDPKLRVAQNSKEIARQLPSVRIDVPDDFIAAAEVGFDDSEHHMIMFACGEARRILDSIMYKLKKMEVPQR